MKDIKYKALLNTILKSKIILAFLLMSVCLQAQTFIPKQLALNSIGGNTFDSKPPYSINCYPLGYDNHNYYLLLEVSWLFGFSNDYKYGIYVIDEDVSSIKEYPINLTNSESFIKSIISEEKISLIIMSYDSDNEEAQVIKRDYSKEDGDLENEQIIVRFPSIHNPNAIVNWSTSPRSFEAISPDSSKMALVFLSEIKKNKYKDFYTLVFDKNGEQITNSKNQLNFTNTEFSTQNIAVNNKGEVFVGSITHSDNSKLPNENSMIEIYMVSEFGNNTFTFPIKDMFYRDLYIKTLKNGNIFMAALVANDDDDDVYPNHINSILFDAEDVNVISNYLKDITPINDEINNTFLNTFDLSMNDKTSLKRFPYKLNIKEVLELKNGEIVINCEQKTDFMTNDGGTKQVRGSVLILFANKEAEINNYNSIIKKQDGSQFYFNFDVSTMGYLSYRIFENNDKIVYVYNDNVKNYTSTDVKYSFTNSLFDYNSLCIVSSMHENNKNPIITPLTGKTSSYRYLAEVLGVNNNKAVIISRTLESQTFYIESIILE
jgi:hypothetical protein